MTDPHITVALWDALDHDLYALPRVLREESAAGEDLRALLRLRWVEGPACDVRHCSSVTCNRRRLQGLWEPLP